MKVVLSLELYVHFTWQAFIYLLITQPAGLIFKIQFKGFAQVVRGFPNGFTKTGYFNIQAPGNKEFPFPINDIRDFYHDLQ